MSHFVAQFFLYNIQRRSIIYTQKYTHRIDKYVYAGYGTKIVAEERLFLYMTKDMNGICRIKGTALS